MEQGPAEPHAGRSTFLLSSGGAGGGNYYVAFDTGPIVTENRFPCQMLVACLEITTKPSWPGLRWGGGGGGGGGGHRGGGTLWEV